MQTLCDQVAIIENGRVSALGEPGIVLPRYAQNGGLCSPHWRRPAETPRRPLQFESAELQINGDELTVDLQLTSHLAHRPAFVAIDVLNSMGAAVMQAVPTIMPFLHEGPEPHRVRVKIELPPLIPGEYALALWAGPHNSETLDFVESTVGFEVERSPTPGRTVSHSPDHGYIVPRSTHQYSREPAPAVLSSPAELLQPTPL